MELHRHLMIDLSGPALTANERAFLAEMQPGGVCLFARNVQDRFQVAELTAELRAHCGEDFLVAVDQEGGGVVRALDVPYPPSAMALGAADDLTLTRSIAAATARGLKAMGINVDFAPVADVNNNPRNSVIVDRAFGGDAAHVTRHIVGFVQGLQAAGVAATAKHFPGHGDTDIDSHLALPTLEADRARLERIELVPFRAAIASGVAAVMSFHGLVPALDPELPATLSRRIMTGLLREELGFDGVVFSDALSMRAITDSLGPAEAAVRALAAGCDMPVHVGPIQEHVDILRAMGDAVDEGRLDTNELERSIQRIRRLGRRYPGLSNPEAAWTEGDEALLAEAARRALVKLGEVQALEPGSDLTLVAARQVATSAASQTTVMPVRELVAALEAQGLSVTQVLYDREALEADRIWVLEKVRETKVVIFVSTSRTRMAETELELAAAVATGAARFIHVALWNPYHVLDLPGPALVSFGFRPRSARAVAEALVSGEATGSLPVPLAPSDPPLLAK
jgi:beta-N-acetylhexosaminidase